MALKRHTLHSDPMGHMKPQRGPGRSDDHKCYTCGHPIHRGQGENQVPGVKNPVRYQHATWEGCQAASRTHTEWWEEIMETGE